MSFINYYVLLCTKHVKSIFFCVFAHNNMYNSDVEVMLHIANLITFVQTKTHSR